MNTLGLQVSNRSFQDVICSSSQPYIASHSQSHMEVWKLLTWFKEVSSVASCNKTMIWVKLFWKGYPSLRSVLNPHWHTSVWQSRVAQTDRLATRKRIYAICVRHQRKIVCWIYRRHRARGRKRQKKVYGVKEASLLVSVSFIFLYFTLCQCLCISFWRLCISSAGCLSVFPEMRQMALTTQPFLHHR